MNLIVAPYFKKFILLAILHNIIHRKYALLLHLDKKSHSINECFLKFIYDFPICELVINH